MPKGHRIRNEEGPSRVFSSFTPLSEQPCSRNDASLSTTLLESGGWKSTLSNFFRRGDEPLPTPSMIDTTTRCNSPSSGSNNKNNNNSSIGNHNDNNSTSRAVARARVGILGDAGSGRTSLASAAAKVADRCGSASDFQSLSSGSFVTYIYQSSVSRRKEFLEMSVVDSGPVPLRGGTARHVLPGCDTIVIAFALTGIKQKYPDTRKLFTFMGKNEGNKEDSSTVLVHAGDQTLLYDLFATIAARISPGGRCPNIILVGTHKDLLTDQTTGAVEVLLKEVRSICNKFLASFRKSLVLNSLFAVNTVDGSCVSENREGPTTMAGMWSFICDVTLKEILSRHSSRISHQASCSDSFWRPHRSPLYAVAPSETCNSNEDELSSKWNDTNDNSSSSHPCSVMKVPVNSRIDAANSKLLGLITRAKAEKKVLFAYRNILWRLLYSSVMVGRRQLTLILEKLQNAGEVVLIRHHPDVLPIRDVCICFHPHLLERAQATVFLYASYANNHSEAHGNLLKDVNLERCGECDPNHDVSRGIFSHRLLLELSPRLKLACFSTKEVETFAMLLLLSDTAILRRSFLSAAMNTGNTSTTSTVTMEGKFNGVYTPNTDCPDFPVTICSSGKRNKEDDFETVSELPCGAPTQRCLMVEYLVPSLIRNRCPHEVIECVRHFAATTCGAKDEQQNNVMSRVLMLHHCPQDFFPMLTSRLHRYMVPSVPIFSETLWLGSLTPAGTPLPLLRACVCHTRDESMDNAVKEGGQISGVSLLEFHAFSDVGYLPLVLLLDDITREAARLIRHEFPGMLTEALPSNVPLSGRRLGGNPLLASLTTTSEMGSFTGMTTLRKLDTLFHSFNS
ncbi:hypothetical protein ECC02_000519 [Trypanosoma cruzi]|uniref:Uncharacterized protein n=1 Tax=Trypanosoma cruzi TaxID=5693 RepID=A0A7J6YI76_TRYCR|nr:hypothetical protein ECC02_000519 [Trypanosoma cruzi]